MVKVYKSYAASSFSISGYRVARGCVCVWFLVWKKAVCYSQALHQFYMHSSFLPSISSLLLHSLSPAVVFWWVCGMLTPLLEISLPLSSPPSGQTPTWLTHRGGGPSWCQLSSRQALGYWSSCSLFQVSEATYSLPFSFISFLSWSVCRGQSVTLLVFSHRPRARGGFSTSSPCGEFGEKVYTHSHSYHIIGWMKICMSLSPFARKIIIVTSVKVNDYIYIHDALVKIWLTVAYYIYVVLIVLWLVSQCLAIKASFCMILN